MLACLPSLTLDDIDRLRVGIRAAGEGAGSMVDAAVEVTRQLAENLVDEAGQRACTTVRLYKTHRLDRLPPHLQATGRMVAPVPDDAQCLVLLAADGSPGLPPGALPEELVLPLVPSVLDEVPIMPRLLEQLGVEIEAAVDPEVARSRQLQQQTLRAFCEPNLAENEELVPNPAHREVLRRLGTRALVSVGGALPTGDLFILALHTGSPVGDEVCDLFRLLAVAIKATLIPYTFTVFEGREGPAGP